MGLFDFDWSNSQKKETVAEEEPKAKVIAYDDEDDSPSARRKARRQGFFSTLIKFILVAAAIITASYFILPKKYAVGPVLIILGFLPLIVLKISGKKISSAISDIVFGTVATAIISLAALFSLNVAEPLGVVVGAAIINLVLFGFAGIFEGMTEDILQNKGIETARNSLSSSMGKMAGCLFGIGIVLTIAWTIIAS